jgi:predicted membrane channel-forming protein YqfA (hemolysin III family)
MLSVLLTVLVVIIVSPFDSGFTQLPVERKVKQILAPVFKGGIWFNVVVGVQAFVHLDAKQEDDSLQDIERNEYSDHKSLELRKEELHHYHNVWHFKYLEVFAVVKVRKELEAFFIFVSQDPA